MSYLLSLMTHAPLTNDRVRRTNDRLRRTNDRVRRTNDRVRRSLDHSPPFSGVQTDAGDDRPATRLPAGGYLTG